MILTTGRLLESLQKYKLFLDGPRMLSKLAGKKKQGNNTVVSPPFLEIYNLAVQVEAFSLLTDIQIPGWVEK